jgi:hypothetical protein
VAPAARSPASGHRASRARGRRSGDRRGDRGNAAAHGGGGPLSG